MVSMRRCAVLILCLAVFLTGCLERREQLTFRSDGSVEVTHELRGDPEDIDSGAVAKPVPGPWQVTRERSVRDDGSPLEKLTARGVFARASDIPKGFGDAQDPGGFRFSTVFESVPRPRGMTHTFVRRYAPQSWARYAYHRQLAIPENVEALLRGQPLEALAVKDQRTIIASFLDYERRKRSEMMLQALEQVLSSEGARLEAYALSTQRLDRFFRERATLAAVQALLASPKAEQGAAAQALERELDAATVHGLSELPGLSAELLEQLLAALARIRRAFEVEEDLSDESFVVSVTLPGEILHHNGTEVSGHTVTWRFAGKDLRDREHVLRASSLEK